MENSAKKYAIPIISIFLLVLATGVYAESDDQPRWNTTIFGAWAFGEHIYLGNGGALGYSFTSGLELEGEVYTMFLHDPALYGVSGALLVNFEISHNKYYLLGGVSTLGAFADRGGAGMFLMLGGGMK